MCLSENDSLDTESVNFPIANSFYRHRCDLAEASNVFLPTTFLIHKSDIRAEVILPATNDS